MSGLKDHPCYPCAYLKKRKLQGVNLRVPHCISPKRRSSDASEWIAPNQQGRKCPEFIEGFQFTLDGLVIEKEVKKNVRKR